MKNRKIDIEVSPAAAHLTCDRGCELSFTADKESVLNHFDAEDIVNHFGLSELLEQMDLRDVQQWAEEQQAKHDAWREIDELKRQNAALVAERDALVAENAIFRSLLKMAQDEFIEAHSDGETDCVTPYDLYHAGPTQCLNEIRAEAARAGYLQCLKDLGRYSEEDDLLTVGDWNRVQAYAERVKRG